jgi:hypothetical protein
MCLYVYSNVFDGAGEFLPYFCINLILVEKHTLISSLLPKMLKMAGKFHKPMKIFDTAYTQRW